MLHTLSASFLHCCERAGGVYVRVSVPLHSRAVHPARARDVQPPLLPTVRGDSEE